MLKHENKTSHSTRRSTKLIVIYCDVVAFQAATRSLRSTIKTILKNVYGNERRTANERQIQLLWVLRCFGFWMCGGVWTQLSHGRHLRNEVGRTHRFLWDELLYIDSDNFQKILISAEFRFSRKFGSQIYKIWESTNVPFHSVRLPLIDWVV